MRARAAEAAFAEHHRALVRDPRLKPAAVALHGGRLDEAEAMLRPIAGAHPNDLAVTSLLGETFARQSRHAEAAALFARVLERRALTTSRPGSGSPGRCSSSRSGAEAMARNLAPLTGRRSGLNAAYQNLMAGALAAWSATSIGAMAALRATARRPPGPAAGLA